MQEGMTATQAVASPQASAPQTSYAPSADSQYATSAPQASPASVAPQQTQQIPAYQAPAQVQQASAPAANPWQQAFQALSASLNTSSPSQPQVSPSAYQTTPTPQTTTPVNWGGMQQSQAVAPQAASAAQTWQAPASTQSFSESEVQQIVNQAVSQSGDRYLNGISDQSLEVLEHFGAEAPALLNNYACAVEDALIEQVQRGNSMSTMLQAAAEERQASNTILTDPAVLSDYVSGFFGPEGPYPVELPQETAARETAEQRAAFEQEIQAQEQNQVPPAFQRPQMDMPQPGRQENASNDFWGGLAQVMDNSPENAWKYLSQAPQGALQSKALIQDL